MVCSLGANFMEPTMGPDTAVDTATACATVNLDMTPPVIAVSAPADPSTVSQPAVTITGCATDALSGTALVTCGGATASAARTYKRGPRSACPQVGVMRAGFSLLRSPDAAAAGSCCSGPNGSRHCLSPEAGLSSPYEPSLYIVNCREYARFNLTKKVN